MSIFAIGNSLTMDTWPPEWASGYHIASGRSADYIYNNPDFVAAGVSWQDALNNNQYDVVTVQPFRYHGKPPTMNEEIAAMSAWVELQPDATFVIHTGWPWLNVREAEYKAGIPEGEVMTWSPEWFSELVGRLESRHPKTTFSVNPAINVLQDIKLDIQYQRNGVPYQELSDFYRDNIHVDRQDGGYLMHNLMRQTIGLPRVDVVNGYTPSPQVKAYLDSKIINVEAIVAVAEPAAIEPAELSSVMLHSIASEAASVPVIPVNEPSAIAVMLATLIALSASLLWRRHTDRR